MSNSAIALAQLASYMFVAICWLTWDMVNLVAECYQDDAGFHYGRHS